MSPTSLIALLGVIETIVQQTPAAIALFNSVKTLMTSGAEPTDAQWAALDAALTADHAAVQAE